MLYDPRWLVPPPLRAPTEPRPRIDAQWQVSAPLNPKFRARWRKILWDTANLIEHEGWVQGHHHNDHGYCLLGALMRVARADQHQSVAMAQLRKHLNLHGRDYRSLPSWNDQRGRTKEEVLAALREAALS